MRLSIVVAVVMGVGGCAAKDHCRVDTDCFGGEVCDDGVCDPHPVYCGSFNPPDHTNPCFLTTFSPQVAPAGTTVVLEGEFPERLAVSLAGLPQRPASVGMSPVPDMPIVAAVPSVEMAYTRPSKHRLEVVIPDVSMTLGKDPAWTGISTLQITDSDGYFNGDPLRYLSFPPAIRGAPIRPPPVGVRQSPKLRTQRSGHCMTLSGHVFFAVGGEDNTHRPLADVERNLANIDGSLGSFVVETNINGQPAPVALSTPRAYAACVEVNDTLYLIGGTGPDGALDSIDRVPLSGDGQLAHAISPPPPQHLMQARTGAMAVVVGNAIYVMGGRDRNDRPLDSVERTVLVSSTELGPFSDRDSRGVPLPHLVTARSDGRALLANGEILVAGGTGADGTLASVEAAPVRDSGLESFRLRTSLQVARALASSVRLGDRLYIMGGSSNGMPLDSIEVAVLDDKLGDNGFSLISPGLVDAGAGAAAVQWQNYIHLVGGSFPEPQQVAFEAGVTLSMFGSVSTMPQIGRTDNAFSAIGRYLYSVGGNELEAVSGRTVGVGDVQVSKLSSGVLNNFYFSSPLLFPRSDATMAVVGNWLYVIGGINAGQFVSAIERGPISPGGVVGPFEVALDDSGQPASLVYPRYRHASVIVKDNLYVIGGTDAGPGSDHYHVIERAPIVPDANGNPMLSAFVAEDPATIRLSVSRENPSVIALGDSIYVIGGATEVPAPNYLSSLASTERLTVVPSTGRLATVCSPRPCHTFEPEALHGARENAGLLVLDNKLLIIGGFWFPPVGTDPNTKTPYITIEAAEILADGLGPWQGFGMLANYRNSPSVAIVNNRLYAFGGIRGLGLCLDTDWSQLVAPKVIGKSSR